MFLRPGDLSKEVGLFKVPIPAGMTVKQFRESLPIYAHKQELLYAIQEYPVTIVVGSTGCGKSTQLVQYLYEVGYEGQIGITEPRRIAAVSLAERVAEEMQVRLGGEVGYAVGWNRQVSDFTRIKFMTDGWAVRELLHDPLLEQYSVLIVDEAHERGVNTDVLLALLKKIMGKRKSPFRLVICSATAEVEKLLEFYPKAAVVGVEGRQYPLNVFYCQETPSDLWLEMVMTIEMIIRDHEPGDILAFLPGREEIRKVGSMLAERGIEDWLPLHAGITAEQQAALFNPDSPHARIILATNVAETAVTLPNLTYVIDCGLVRERHSLSVGIDALNNVPISQASATQRAGRCGRTGPGMVFRLYTEQDYLARPVNTTPEVQRCALRHIWLLLLALGVKRPQASFWLDAPATSLLASAIVQLQSLDAVDAQGMLTIPRGMMMAEMPLDPLQGRMVIGAAERGCLPEMLRIVALWSALSGDNLFTVSLTANLRKRLGVEEGDLISYHNIYLQYCEHGNQWAQRHHLNMAVLNRAKQAHSQLQSHVRRLNLQTLTNDSVQLIQRVIASCLSSQVAHAQPDGTFKQGNVILAMHPDSFLFQRVPPLVVFGEALVTEGSKGRALMRHVTPIQPDWLNKAN